MTIGSKSWHALRPFKNFDHFDDGDETEEEYIARLKPEYDIPLEVAEQWLYCHYCNHNTLQNYSWMDFRALKFERIELKEAIILKLNVISDFQPFVNERSANRDYDDFTCLQADVNYWRTESTWRVPPIVLDVKSIPKPPPTADIRGPYQLVEGHSRLGYFLALKAATKLTMKNHWVYLLTSKL